MRILHTSDWHLGHVFYNISRTEEHRNFLFWLLQQIKEQDVDVLLITGDIFHSANPSADVLRQWYQFLGKLQNLEPQLQVIVIGGNHDSPGRLDAPKPLLMDSQIHIIGGIPRTASGHIDNDAMCIPLKNKSGEILAWCAAMPYIRVSDLSGQNTNGEDRLVAGVRDCYETLFEVVTAKATEDQAIITTGHCYMANSQMSEDSERKILGGHLQGLPQNLFPERLAYVALGHLHLPQAVGNQNRIRYAGSPLPLSFGERDYEHQVLLVDLQGNRLQEVTPIPVPHYRSLIRLQEGSEEEVMQELERLPNRDATSVEERRPLLEIRVQLEKPSPNLRQRLETAMAEKEARLVKISTKYKQGDGLALPERKPEFDLKEMQPEDIFIHRYQKDHEGDVPKELLAAFSELLDEVGKLS